MIYSQNVIIPDAGIIRIGTIGGSPDVESPHGRMQVGRQIPTRLGQLRWSSVSGNNPALLDVVASVEGYFGRVSEGIASPGTFITEFPCSVVFEGPPGTAIIVEAWPLTSASSRGGKRTVQAGTHLVPEWAGECDLSGSAVFYDMSSVSLGSFSGSFIGLSVPARARTVDVTSGTLTFRQGL